MLNIYHDLISLIDENKVMASVPMNEHTSFKVGGPADYFLTPNTIEEITKIINYCVKENIDYYIIGSGTNTLVRDSGYRGIIIKPDLRHMEIISKDKTKLIVADSSILLNELSYCALDNNLSGLEYAVGMKATLGGAIRMNAGCFNQETKDIVKEIKYIDEDGNIKTMTNKDAEFGYRSSIFKDKNYIIIEALLELTPSPYEEIEQRMNANIKRRKETQPIDLPSAGSTFKRGENYIASQLIDQAGLKGTSVGGAEVSKKHAGFIINTGTATAQDILDLIELVKDKVKEKFKVSLETEIIIIGED